MKTFKDLVFERLQISSEFPGLFSEIVFDNNYGVRVLKTSFPSTCGNGLFDVQLIDSNKKRIYESDSVENRLTRQTPEMITDYMVKIQNLSKK